MKLPALAGVWVLTAAITLAAGTDSSLSDTEIEFTEAKVTLQSVLEENALLKSKLSLAQEQVKSLTESLALASNEADVFRRQAGEMKLRMEALGIDAAAPDKEKLEQRLLKAVSDLRIAQQERDKLSNQLIAMSEAVVGVLKTAENVDPDVRMAMEAQIRATNEALGLAQGAQPAQAEPASLTDAMVLSVKEDLALVVANVGSQQGVQLGMPFEVQRDGHKIATVRVVDVRQNIAGAVIQDQVSERDPIKVGDHLRVAAQQ